MVQEQVATTVEYEPGFWNRLSASTDPAVWKVVSKEVLTSTSISHAERQGSGLISVPTRGGAYIFSDKERSGDIECIAPVSTGMCWNWPVGKQGTAVLSESGREGAVDNRTRLAGSVEGVEKEIQGLFGRAEDEHFEDGMDSDFSNELIQLVKRHGKQAIEVITYLVLYGKAGQELGSEALRWIGRIEDQDTYDYRRWLLERTLTCSSAMVRDGAGLGLASMDDPHAIPSLQKAIERERCAELRENLGQVLNQLQECP